MGMSGPANGTHANGRVGSGSAKSIFPTGPIGSSTWISAPMVNAGFSVAALGITLALSLFD